MRKVWIGCILVLAVLMIAGCKPSGQIPVCGDGNCDLISGETSANCPADCPPEAKQARLYVQPATVNANIGDLVSLDFNVADAANLLGYQFDLSYDPSILEFQELKDGDFLSDKGNNQVFCVDYKASAGEIRNVICAKLGEGGLYGSGLLKTITFKAVASGKTEIALSNLKLADDKAQDLPFTFSNGEVIVS